MSLLFPKPAAVQDRITKRTAREVALRQARLSVWDRDQHRCRACARMVSHAGRVRGEVHHLVARSRSKPLRADRRNLVLLCAACHSDVTRYRLRICGDNADQTLTFEHKQP